MRHLPLALLVLVCTPGCFLNRRHVHSPLPVDAIAELQPGVSTAREVVERLGAPNEVVQLGRRSAYRYDRTVEKQEGLFLILLGLRGVDSQQDRAWFFFDENEILTHLGTTFEAQSAEYGVPLFD